jgi:propanol-preferring alcohol dehydrogenase
VKLKASGCCHTDIHAIDGDWGAIQSKLPLTIGHEGVGVIVELGSEVKHLKVGDAVGIAWLHEACGHCESCNTGWETLCANQSTSGFSVDGCCSEYALGKASHVIPVPTSIPAAEIAPLLCAGVTSYKALKETEVRPGEFVTIVGAAGGLGHLSIQYAKAMGMIVIAVDVGQDKLDFCLLHGADYGVDAKDPEATKKIMDITVGGSHGVLCLATNIRAFETAVTFCRRKGTFVCVALPGGEFHLPLIEVVLKRVTIRGSIVGTRQDAKEAIAFAERGQVHCIVERQPFENVAEVYNNLRAGKVQGRIVLEFAE